MLPPELPTWRLYYWRLRAEWISYGTFAKPPETSGNMAFRSMKRQQRSSILCRLQVRTPITLWRNRDLSRSECRRQVRLVVVAHTQQDDAIRIISARKATRAERKLYEEA